MTIKKRVPFIEIIALVGVLSIGGSFAYFYTETDIKNFFSVEPYNAIAYENFSSPTDWKPSNITKKEVFAKNLSNHDVIARASYTETWISSSGKILPNVLTYDNGRWLSSNGEDYSSMVNDNFPHANGDTFQFAIKHFQNSDWIDGNDGYYYYQKILHKDETSTAFLGAVEFNGYTDDMPIGVNINGIFDESLYVDGEYQGYTNGDERIFSYVNSNDGYFNARYSLIVKVEFADASTQSMLDVFNYDINSKSNGAESLYNLLLNG
ncbi:MAG: BsaA family SipW-dependent biofilm matrix protein [Oscillospiraceae bacterium]